jgi:3-oxoadipate enol-lactonase
MAETRIAVEGGELWADDSGGDGHPLVLVHSGVSDARLWDPVWPALAASYRVIRYEDRGYGRSPAPSAPFCLLTDLIAVLDHYGLDQVAIVGCSQGGGSGLGLALAQPARVTALVLLCPGIPGYPWPQPSEAEEAAEAEYGRAVGAGDVDTMARLQQGLWAAAGPTLQIMELLRSAARAEIAAADLEQPSPPVLDRLAEISVPTALLVGDADYPPLIEADLQAAARIPGCELTVVPGMDHFPPQREPELVLAAISGTLARASWPGRSAEAAGPGVRTGPEMP